MHGKNMAIIECVNVPKMNVGMLAQQSAGHDMDLVQSVAVDRLGCGP
jgi:hypothetical protein